MIALEKVLLMPEMEFHFSLKTQELSANTQHTYLEIWGIYSKILWGKPDTLSAEAKTGRVNMLTKVMGFPSIPGS